MKVRWSLLAVERLEEIVEYVAADKLKAAQSLIETIANQVENLKDFPESHRQVPELRRDDIREILYSNYRILYKLEENSITVLTVRHGKQLLQPKQILAML